MRRNPISAWLIAILFLFATSVFNAPHVRAQSSAAPQGATAQCKDGSYSTAATKRGACSGHGGIGTWFTEAQPATKGAPKGTKSQAKTAETTGTHQPAAAPAKATGQCKDGSYTTASSKRGACSGHGGIGTWFADKSAAPSVGTTGSMKGQQPSQAAPPSAAPSAEPRARAQTPPAEAPVNATAQCNDGTYTFAKQHRGACSNHHGVKTWFK
jgi:hypothetical protein